MSNWIVRRIVSYYPGKMFSDKRKKVVVYRYKRKTGYHKKNGHRQCFTRVKIDAING